MVLTATNKLAIVNQIDIRTLSRHWWLVYFTAKKDRHNILTKDNGKINCDCTYARDLFHS